MPTDTSTDRQPASAETLAAGIGGVVTAALSVGAALARTAAAATSPAPAASSTPAGTATSAEAPLREIVHYSVEAAANFVRLIVQNVNLGTAPQPAAQATPEEPARPAHPAVHAGSVLRIPLSIQNPTDVEMTAMSFTCGSLIYQGSEGGELLAEQALSFQPNPLTIAARDFEKLTVFITTPETAAHGIYLAHINVLGGDFDSTLAFEVLPA